MKSHVLEVMHSSKKQDWHTPKILFDKLNTLYGPFTLDAAANSINKCVNRYFGFQENGEFIDSFKQNWDKCTFLNPEYGRSIGKWTRKAAEEAKKGCTVVCLVPSRTGSTWFQDAMKEATEVLFLKGRVIFESEPGKPVLDKKGKPMAAPFDSAVIVFTENCPADIGHEPLYRWWDWKKYL